MFDLIAYPGCNGRHWFLEEVPEKLLVRCALGVPELVLVPRLERLGLLPHLLVHVLLPLVVLVLAARLQVELVDAPKVEVVAESQDAHVLHQVELPGPVKVQDGRKRPGMAVEKVLVVHEIIVVAELHQGLVRVALPKAAEFRVGKSVQRSPEDLVLCPADVEQHPPVQRLGSGDHERIGYGPGGTADPTSDPAAPPSSPAAASGSVPIVPVAHGPSDPATTVPNLYLRKKLEITKQAQQRLSRVQVLLQT